MCMVQVVHKEQYDEKRQVLQEATTVDDMYDMLAVYEQKVVTADQVRDCIKAHAMQHDQQISFPHAADSALRHTQHHLHTCKHLHNHLAA